MFEYYILGAVTCGVVIIVLNFFFGSYLINGGNDGLVFGTVDVWHYIRCARDCKLFSTALVL